uniref:Uncharacterized protein n=1 Tax=Cyclophora tenuis TaxID=216820 RepID=A0A7S1D4I8_CYCTE
MGLLRMAENVGDDLLSKPDDTSLYHQKMPGAGTLGSFFSLGLARDSSTLNEAMGKVFTKIWGEAVSDGSKLRISNMTIIGRVLPSPEVEP